jgi:Glycosyl hydrolase catalytic core
MKRVLVLILGAALLVAVTAQSTTASKSAPASKRLLVGIYDEAETLGRPDRAFPVLGTLGVKAVRANLYWGGPNGVAKRRPDRPTNPEDPAYDWFKYDRMVTMAAEENIKVVFAIVGTPRWANGGKATNRAPLRAAYLRDFARAAATRYSGFFTPFTPAANVTTTTTTTTTAAARRQAAEALPSVKHWLAWNEPNNPVFLAPQFIRTQKGVWLRQAAKNYARICNAIVSGIHAAPRLSGEQVACGVTAPRGNNNPKASRQSISPIPFVRQMKRFGARGFDAYAHHPYYGHPRETPTYRPKLIKGPRIVGGPVLLGNIHELIREVTKLWGRKPIWITEYGYQTKPDRHYAVTNRQQANYLKQAFAITRKNPRIDMMLWFLLRDQGVTRAFDGWQGGLLTKGGARKPAFQAFRQVRK